MDSYSLIKVNEYIKQVISLNFEESIWIDAEISQIKEVRGQIYLEFIQKSENDEAVIAKAQGVIWYKSVLFIKKKLGELYNSILEEGRQIRFKAIVEFHEIYGLKFSIEDIEPSFTLGSLEIQRQKTIEKLKNEGLLYKNQNTTLHVAIKNIAVISSSKAAGYQDFTNHLTDNPYGYIFNIDFYESSMQGMMVERELIKNLDSINENIAKFDCVVIIRGGGSKMDLSYFDSFEICKNVALFPIPVITGIGHDIDKNVIELVAHSPMKTPTAVADFIIQHNLEFESHMINAMNYLLNYSVQRIKLEENEVNSLKNKILNQSVIKTNENKYKLELNHSKLEHATIKIFTSKNHELAKIENSIRLYDPNEILNRGYSYTTIDGKTIKSIDKIEKDDIIKTHIADGVFESVVK